VVEWILRSSFSGLLESSVMLVTLKGRRTGREYTLPVQYADDGDRIWVLVGRPERKTWWRNLQAETPIHFRHRGKELAGTARAFRGETDPSTIEGGLRAYLRRFPGAARLLGIPDRRTEIAGGTLERVVPRTVMVRIIPARE
jgi:deazaflavin-dependent oxidoreductase (nitroreductase family)